MRRSLSSQLSIIFMGFLLLVIVSPVVTFRLAQTQRNDSVIVNLAGRQRMRVQQMMRLALMDPDNPELHKTAIDFEQTLTALTNGGAVMDGDGRAHILPPTSDPVIRNQLEDVAAFWPIYRNNLTLPVNGPQLESESAVLLSRLDDIVSAFESRAQLNNIRLWGAQIAFWSAALLLLVWGYRLVRHQLLQPLAELGQAAQEIGAGHREVPLPALPPNELGQLAQTMEKMRGEIAASQNSLEQRVAQRTDELSAAFEFSQEIVRQLDIDELLHSVAQRAQDLMQGNAASVCVLDNSGNALELVAESGSDPDHLGLRQSASRGIALSVIQQQQTVLTEGKCANCGFLHHYPGSACIATPMRVGDRALGALCVIRPQRPFDGDESRALRLLANAAAIGLENARLIAAGKKQAEENALLAERERLAAELHDNLAQTLGAAQFSAGRLAQQLNPNTGQETQARLAELQSTLQEAYAQARVALTGLHETPPNDIAFMARVRKLFADFEGQTGVSVCLDDIEGVGSSLSVVTQKQVLHILGEALTNIRRHAQAGQVRLTICREENAISFTVEDDGRGFDPERINGQNHLGLAIMHARAKRCRGDLHINSVPAQGTQIRATFPIRSDVGRKTRVAP